MAWIQDPLKKRIHWTSVVLAVAGFVAWGLIAQDFRWAWISFAVVFGIRLAIFQYLAFRDKRYPRNGTRPAS